MGKLTIKNETRWSTTAIKAIVRACESAPEPDRQGRCRVGERGAAVVKMRRQGLLWVPEAIDPKNGAAPRPPPIPFVQPLPDRVWTLYQHRDPSQPPELPYQPWHHHNAFLEDYVHDWDVFKKTFRYNSRALDGRCWLLLEWKE